MPHIKKVGLYWSQRMAREMDVEELVVDGISELGSFDVGLSPALEDKCEDIAYFLGKVCPNASIDQEAENWRCFPAWSDDEEKAELDRRSRCWNKVGSLMKPSFDLSEASKISSMSQGRRVPS